MLMKFAPEIDKKICDEWDFQSSASFRLFSSVNLKLVKSRLWEWIDEKDDFFWSLAFRYEWEKRILKKMKIKLLLTNPKGLFK